MKVIFFSLNEYLEEIKRGIGDKSLLDSNTTMLDSQQLTPNQLREVCTTLPFLAPKRLVIVNGLLERFEPRVGQGRQKKKVKDDQPKDHEAFAALIDEFPDSTVLVFIDCDVKNKNPLLKELLPRAKQAETDDEFGLVCLELVARLEDSHAHLQKGTLDPPWPPVPRWAMGLAWRSPQPPRRQFPPPAPQPL